MANVFTRDDTFFGVCQAIGDDFGFNPNYLRAVFGASLLFSPVAVLAFYAAAGIAVALSRLIVPEPRAAFASDAAQAAPVPAGGNDNGERALLAA